MYFFGPELVFGGAVFGCVLSVINFFEHKRYDKIVNPTEKEVEKHNDICRITEFGFITLVTACAALYITIAPLP